MFCKSLDWFLYDRDLSGTILENFFGRRSLKHEGELPSNSCIQEPVSLLVGSRCLALVRSIGLALETVTLRVLLRPHYDNVWTITTIDNNLERI